MAQDIEELTIRFPARSGYLTVSRLNAAAIGSAVGFDLDDLDDLRLAVDEAVTWLLTDEASGGEVELVMRARDGEVRIDGTREGGGELPESRIGDLIEAILGATVDSFELSGDGPMRRRLRLTKTKASVRDD